ncbi:unnamed protein product [Kuraishia capsulata CBS 1993]|uniref:PXA domain-containing protein n=1 Tax=Kuraishia capsulata CBS 1993 TaxID=1382522 RepID=W6MKM1_9ASCO|nr:uncharacterized protein KUCA_T00002520001 [Kuraishia capsulata CBS 1993]CDK26548.1 unnamed protein product [Kuraishia capsulata CBS 1993]
MWLDTNSDGQLRASWHALVLIGIVGLALSQVWLYTIHIFLGSLTGICLVTYVVSHRPKVKPKKDLSSRFPRLAFTSESAWSNEIRKLSKSSTKDSEELLFSSSAAISGTLEKILESVTTSFIDSWFTHITSDRSFPLELQHQLRITIRLLAQRLDDLDLAEFVVLRVLPLVTEHFVNFQKAEEIVMNRQNVILNRSLTSSSDLDYVVASNYNKGKLHPVIKLKNVDLDSLRKEYISAKVGRLLPVLFSNQEISSPPVFVLLREILTCCVLHPCLSLLSEPDFWNQTIVSSAGKVVRDQDQVKQFMTVLDKHSKNRPVDTLTLKRLALSTDNVEFKEIIKDVKHCKSIFELKQYRYYLSLEINKSIRELETRQTSNYDLWKIYSKRLQILKQETNNSISQLSQKADLLKSSEDSTNFNPSTIPRNYLEMKIDFLQILNNPSLLSFFMEFMERRNRTVLLQFWLTVNGINDPLDTLNTEDSLFPKTDAIEDDTAHLGQTKDIISIYNQFFQEKLLKINQDTFETVSEFVKSCDGDEVDVHLFTLARKSVLILQKEVFKRMNRTDLIAFKQSEIFLKLLATEEFKTSDDYDRSGLDSEDLASSSHNLDSIMPTKQTEDTVLKAVEEALNEIMTQREKIPMTAIGSEGSSPGSSVADLPKNGRLLTPDLQREVFGMDSSTLFSEIGENDKLFDSDTENDEDEDDEDDRLSVGSVSLAQSQGLTVAAPGDLNLSEEIAKLSKDVERLEQQESILEPLINKAMLTNNQAELKILKRSKLGLQREIQMKDLQRQQYIVQENDNSLFGKSKVSIQSFISDVENDKGKEFILYIIEVQRLSTKDPSVVTAGWVIARRFSQFYKLNEYLKSKYPEVKDLPFPSRKVVLKFQQKSLVEERKNQLEQYLQKLIQMSDVCSDRLFRSFLSSKVFSLELNASLKSETKVNNNRKNIANKIYSRISATNGLLMLPATFASGFGGSSDDKNGDKSYDEKFKEMRQELTSFDNDEGNDNESVPFVRPICDFLTAVFSFGPAARNGWLRGRAVLVVLQQLLGSTIEKIARDYIGLLKGKVFINECLTLVKDKLWPNGDGNFRQSGIPRNQAEKTQTRQEAKVLLEQMIVENCSKLFGLSHSKLASNLFMRMLQNEILNVHLVYEIFDELLRELFPDVLEE